MLYEQIFFGLCSVRVRRLSSEYLLHLTVQHAVQNEFVSGATHLRNRKTDFLTTVSIVFVTFLSFSINADFMRDPIIIIATFPFGSTGNTQPRSIEIIVIKGWIITRQYRGRVSYFDFLCVLIFSVLRIAFKMLFWMNLEFVYVFLINSISESYYRTTYVCISKLP